MMKKASEELGIQEYKDTMVHIHTCEKNLGPEFSKLQKPSYKTSYIIFSSSLNFTNRSEILENLAELLSLLYLCNFKEEIPDNCSDCP